MPWISCTEEPNLNRHSYWIHQTLNLISSTLYFVLNLIVLSSFIWWVIDYWLIYWMYSRWKTVPLPLAWMSVALRSLRRADAPLPQTHRCQTVPLQGVRKMFRPLWSLGSPHETSPAQIIQITNLFISKLISNENINKWWWEKKKKEE